jgi:hypothetical protein
VLSNLWRWLWGIPEKERRYPVKVTLTKKQLRALDVLRDEHAEYTGKRKSRSDVMKWIITRGYGQVLKDIRVLNNPQHHQKNPFSDHKVPPTPKPKKKKLAKLTLVKGDKE